MKNKELEEITQILLNKDSTHIDLLNTSRGLAEFFEHFSHVSTKISHYEAQGEEKHTYLDSGIAISPLDAAICTNEYMRTTKYIRGVYEAISDLLLEFTDEKIHILYAGCGPYATLIIPILSLFDPKRVEVSFLDIHQSSLDSVKNILKGLNLEDFVSEYIEGDASKYKVSKATHLMITETMKAAFSDEPQVPITLNLLPQLNPKGIFIPQRVLVGFEEAYYTMVEKDNMFFNQKDSKYLCDVMDMDSSKNLLKDNIVTNKKYSLISDPEVKRDFQFTTIIYLYKEHILGENECSLNIPKILRFEKEPLKGDEINFKYLFSNKPKIDYKLT